MKKVFILLVVLLSACSLYNTPTIKVEDMLSKYQKYDKSLRDDYLLFNNSSKYEELVKKQYMNMSYEIKDEKIDGDNARVLVEIEVYDYSKYIDSDLKYDNKYYDDIYDKLKKERDKKTYKIEFNLYKNSSDIWTLNSVSKDIKYKLLGIYS